MQIYEDLRNDVENEMDLAGQTIEEQEDEQSYFDDEAAVITSDSDSKKGEKLDIVQRFVFFDFETTQEKVLRNTALGDEFEHVPNVCVAMITCDDCRNRDFEVACGRCLDHERIFTGDNCLNDFCKFLFAKNMKNTTAIAHNARGFDSQFILQYLYKEGIRPDVIANGKYLFF